jgi:hypothetical protein
MPILAVSFQFIGMPFSFMFRIGIYVSRTGININRVGVNLNRIKIYVSRIAININKTSININAERIYITAEQIYIIAIAVKFHNIVDDIYSPSGFFEGVAEKETRRGKDKKVDYFCLPLNKNNYANLSFKCRHEYKHSL